MSEWKPELDSIEKQADYLIPLKIAERLAQDTIPKTQRKKGRWVKISPAKIYECSVCGQNVMTDDIDVYTFCHGCGAKMEGAEDAGRNE